MKYNFKCKKCGKTQEKEINMKDYDKLKNSQACDDCGGKLERIIEWQGTASGSGDGWFGKSNGCKSI